MADRDNENVAGEPSPPGVILWALVLGASGLVAGVFGPTMVDPQMPQGSLASIIVTGPLALLFGMLLGKAMQRSGLNARLQWQVLFGCVAALVLATLYFCLGD
ncbi:MAG TPA: hypothetical protein VLC92_00190 [Rhodocyclaceae bacterium]|nr:hypothetical protein [Rhodocyclaceae bacterium]